MTGLAVTGIEQAQQCKGMMSNLKSLEHVATLVVLFLSGLVTHHVEQKHPRQPPSTGSFDCATDQGYRHGQRSRQLGPQRRQADAPRGTTPCFGRACRSKRGLPVRDILR